MSGEVTMQTATELENSTDSTELLVPTAMSVAEQIVDALNDADLSENLYDQFPTDLPEIMTTDNPLKPFVWPIGWVITSYVVTAVLIILALFGVVGNSLVIVCVAFNRKLRFVTYWALVSLSLSDILFGVAAIPLDVASKLTRSIFWCRATYIIINALHVISVLNLLMIGVWRLVLVLSPTAPNLKKTGRVMKAALLILWLYATGIGFLSQVAWKKEFAIITNDCIFEMITEDWYLALTKAHPLVCTISLVCIYTAIVVILRRRRETVSSNSASSNWKRRENKLTKTMFIVFMNFLACYSFYYFVYARIVFDRERFVPQEWIQGFVAFGVTMNGVMNPFIYMAKIPEFKVTVTQIKASISRSSGSTPATGSTKLPVANNNGTNDSTKETQKQDTRG